MGEHSFLSLLHKLVRIISFLLLWQFGCCGGRGISVTYGGGDCNETQGLPCKEVEALQNVLDSLGSQASRTFNNIAGSFCEDNKLDPIICNCSTTSKVCHIIEISLANFGLHGFIHKDVSNLAYLQSLNLGSNQLSGSIPKSLGNLGSLTALDLSENFLTWRIPPSLGNMSSLQRLDLSSNKLEGKIPNELGNLPNLIYLKLDENRLRGQLPPELGNLRNLKVLWLTSNNFTGELPPAYSELKSLEQFEIGGNNLTGTIPDYIHTHWVNLTDLNLMGNNFEGELHPGIFNMSKLQFLWVSDLQNPSFFFPPAANLMNMFSLILRNCSINGKIPWYMGEWSQLYYLDLSFNNLTDEIPLFNHSYLRYMSLRGNMLSGKVPAWVNDNVTSADLTYNNFTKGDLANVTSEAEKRVINMTYINQISEYCKDKKSKYHSLFINSGGEEVDNENIHYEADNDTSLFYASKRKTWAYTCSGDFPSQSYNSSDYIKSTTCGASDPLYEKSRLCPVSLTYYGFCLQEGRYNVGLHFAETVYAQDQDYSILGKRVFDVYIQGVRELKDFNIKEEAGRPNKPLVKYIETRIEKPDSLLTIHFFWAGKGSVYNPGLNGPLISAIAVTPKFKVHRKLTAWEIVGITVGSVFALLLLLLALLWRIGLVGNKELYEKKIEIRGKFYSLKQLKDATRNFKPNMEIGRGQFGGVYKAEFPDQTVAVKKLSANPKQVIHEIETEVYALKSFKHENLVELLATYSRKGLNLVIYEYMEHKSLKEALFDSHSVILPWEVRYNICLGVAEGLKYLHGRTPRVIHRNIKASIVLLDGSFKAKISDFGLSKLYEEENPYLVIGIKGTLAYMAPEYATRRAISDKVDVYSFGVLVLEIVSGRDNATYNENQETVFLLDEACVSHTKGRLLNLVDRKLSSYDRVQVLTVLNLAMMCIDQSPTLRPTMSEVVDVLEGNKTIEQISKVATPLE